MMKRSLPIMLGVFMVVLLAACQTPTMASPAAVEQATATQPEPTVTPTIKIFEFPTATIAPTATFSPQMLEWMQPAGKIAGNSPVTIHYRSNAEIELIDGKGQRVLVDIVSPSYLSAPVAEADLLFVTHGHQDHLNSLFVKAFPGQKMISAAGTLTAEGVAARGIPSQHGEGDELSEKYASNYIYIIDIGGLRVVHFGDLGQVVLVPEQLAAIGEVDVAIMQLSNSYSGMSLANKKGFNLLEQVNPRLIIPTHMDAATGEYAGQVWKAFYTEEKFVTISPENLPSETTILFMGGNRPYGEKAKAALWEK